MQAWEHWAFLLNGLQGDLQVIFTQRVRPAWGLSPCHPLCNTICATCDMPSSFVRSWYGLSFCGEHSFDKDGNGISRADELMRPVSVATRSGGCPAPSTPFLSFVDVDDSNTVSFEEFALALKRAEDDFVLKEVCVWTRHHMAPRRTGFSTVLLVCDAQTLRSPLVLTSVLDGCLF